MSARAEGDGAMPIKLGDKLIDLLLDSLPVSDAVKCPFGNGLKGISSGANDKYLAEHVFTTLIAYIRNTTELKAYHISILEEIVEIMRKDYATTANTPGNVQAGNRNATEAASQAGANNGGDTDTASTVAETAPSEYKDDDTVISTQAAGTRTPATTANTVSTQANPTPANPDTRNPRGLTIETHVAGNVTRLPIDAIRAEAHANSPVTPDTLDTPGYLVSWVNLINGPRNEGSNLRRQVYGGPPGNDGAPEGEGGAGES